MGKMLWQLRTIRSLPMLENKMIDGVLVTPLRVFADHRGSVMHMLRADAPHFVSFGEIYFSTVNDGVIKGWRRHTRMIQNVAVPAGRIQFVLYDDRHDSPTRGNTQQILLGPQDTYALLTIQPNIWCAFKGLSEGASVMANCASIGHDPAEGESLALPDLPVEVKWL
jgi:dTDP-4-dehydrorhamnose 3,5-epimerase